MNAPAKRAKGRAIKRLDAAVARKKLAAEAACKAQQQRDDALSDLELAKKATEALSDEVESLKEAAASRVEPSAPRSTPAKGGLPKVRPNESGDSDDSVRAKKEKTEDGDRSSSESDGDGSGGDTGPSSADSTTVRKRRPGRHRAATSRVAVKAQGGGGAL